MNVRSAILQRLESGQATLEQLLELDYLDRLITRTLTRMVRHDRLEEYGGVYALIGQFKGPKPAAVKATPVKVVPAPVVKVVPTHVSPFTPAPVEEVVERGFEEQLDEVFEIMEDIKDDSLDLLNDTVKNIVALLPTLELAKVASLKEAELAGKARKGVIAAIEKLQG